MFYEESILYNIFYQFKCDGVLETITFLRFLPMKDKILFRKEFPNSASLQENHKNGGLLHSKIKSCSISMLNKRIVNLKKTIFLFFIHKIGIFASNDDLFPPSFSEIPSVLFQETFILKIRPDVGWIFRRKNLTFSPAYPFSSLLVQNFF